MLTILSLATLLTLPQNEIDLEGLAAGESACELAPAPELGTATPPEREIGHGRIIDASTALPVADASVEVWTEEITAPTQGFRRIGEVRTGRDGRFAIRVEDGTVRSEKLRVTAAGYLVWSGTAGDIFDTIRLFRIPTGTPPLRLRFIDPQRRPIPGARVTSTYSCAHDLPAFELESNAVGEVRLVGFDLQDHTPELRIRAAGFGAVKYLNLDEVLLRHPRTEPLEVILHSCEPFALRLLDTDGTAMPGRTLMIIDGDGFHVARTDADAIARIPARYGADDVVVQLFEGDDTRFVVDLTPVHGRTLTARKEGWDGWPAETAVGTVKLDASLRPTNDAAATAIVLQHDDGWIVSPNDEDVDIECPAGGVTVILGSSHAQRIQVPESGSVTVAAPAAGVPPKRAFDSATRRAPLSEPTDPNGMTLAREVLVFTSSGDGEAFTTGEVAVKAANAIAPRLAANGGIEIQGIAGTQYLAKASRKGHATVWVRGQFGDERGTIGHVVPALASLSIAAPFDLEIVGGDDLDLDALTPGPLDLVVQREDGRRYGISLFIEPGAERRLRFVR